MTVSRTHVVFSPEAEEVRGMHSDFRVFTYNGSRNPVELSGGFVCILDGEDGGSHTAETYIYPAHRIYSINVRTALPPRKD